MRFLAVLRLPLFILGLVLLFLADRYLGAESYHAALRGAAFGLCGLGALFTVGLCVGAAKAGRAGEAKSWRLTLVWQVVVLVALGLYVAYGRSLGAAGVGGSFANKALLGGWLVLLCLGFFGGAGIEWAARESGHGETAEPQRVARAGLSWLGVGMLFVFLVCVNFAGDKKNKGSDWSYLKIRTPSASTLNLIKASVQPVTIALFYPQGNEVKTLVTDYFNAVQAADPKIKVQYLDKDMNPTEAEAFKVSRSGQIVLDSGGKKARVDTGTTIAKARKTLKDLDIEFQKAFLDVTADKKTIYFTRGHGESSWIGGEGEGGLKSIKLVETFLRQQNYSTRFFGVAEGAAERVPDDASAVVIVGPTQPFSVEEVAALKTYVEGGGNLMVFLEPDKVADASSTQLATPAGGEGDPLVKLVAEMGIRYNDVPLANEKNFYPGTHSDADKWFLFTNVFTSHDSVVSLARHEERIALVVFRAGYLSVTPELGKWRSFETVRSLPDTFPDKNRNFKNDPDEKKDAYVLGAVAEIKDKKVDAKKKTRQSRVVVFTDATAIGDQLIQAPANGVFFIDSLKWLVGESETMGEIATNQDVKIQHSNKESAVWFYSTIGVVPALVLLAGYLATRRGKRGGDAA